MTSGRPEHTSTGRLMLIAAWLMLLVILASTAAYVMALPPDAARLSGTSDVRLSLGSVPDGAPAQADPAPQDASPSLAGAVPDRPAIALSESPAEAPTSAPAGAGASDEPRTSRESPPDAAAPPEMVAAVEDAAPSGGQPQGSDALLAALPPVPAPQPEPEDDEPSVVTVAPSEAEPRTPAWQRHAHRMTPPGGRARIAVVVQGLGLSSAATEAAIQQLPAAISLSFTPYARSSPDWAMRARRSGHEVLVDLPMEPRDFPSRDPGPQALMVERTQAQNLDRLEWVLSKGRDVVGVVAQMGSAFMAEPRVAEPILQDIRARGLMYVDNGELADGVARQVASEIGLPLAVNDRSLDNRQVSRAAIEARLIEIERIAREEGVAVALANPFPVTIDALRSWSRDLDERGFVLIPVTQAVAEKRVAERDR